MSNLRSKILGFLYEQVDQGKIPNIRKGMAEDFEVFVTNLLSDREVHKSADRMKAVSEDRMKAVSEGKESQSEQKNT